MTESTQVKKYLLITTHKIFYYIIQIKHMKQKFYIKKGAQLMEDTNLAYGVLGRHFTLVMKKSAPLNVSKLLSLFSFYKV